MCTDAPGGCSHVSVEVSEHVPADYILFTGPRVQWTWSPLAILQAMADERVQTSDSAYDAGTADHMQTANTTQT